MFRILLHLLYEGSDDSTKIITFTATVILQMLRNSRSMHHEGFHIQIEPQNTPLQINPTQSISQTEVRNTTLLLRFQ